MIKTRSLPLGLGVAALAALAVLAGPTRAQDVPSTTPVPAEAAAADAKAWPRLYEEDGLKLALYQPQPEKWDYTTFVARAALAVESGTSGEVFGVVWIQAHTHVNKEQRKVTLEDFEVIKSNFPTAPEHADEWARALAKHFPESKVADLDRMQAALAAAGARSTADKSVPLGEDAPQIFFSSSPALLVLVDGEPVLRPLPTGTQRVMNTRALLLQDSSGFFLGVGQRWLTAPSLQGPWSMAPAGPAGGDDARTSLQTASLVDLHEEDAELNKLMDSGGVPRIFVTSRPAELVETTGDPQLVPVTGTGLLWAKNSDGDIFVDTGSNMTYVLIGGRWFRARSREGPWETVPAGALPADFAKIPEAEPAGEVLSSVSGTPEAQEALIANDVPQTAVVDRTQTGTDIVYDGDPRFEPVQGTSFGYAVNTLTPVIQFGYQYYACEDGVWFTSTSPNGPWAVAAVVPAAIYTIPPSCPIYYVSFVRIYEAKPGYICFGYTPGYLGCCVRGGCVVWGTGYRHRAWCEHQWIGRPCTYGFGAGLRWGHGVGFSVGLAVGSRPACRPWWGPLGRPHSAFYPARVAGVEFHLNMGNANIYASWPERSVRAHHTLEAPVQHFEARTERGRAVARANDVFASPDGRVYRHTATGGWERHDAGRWQAAPAGEAERVRGQQLEAERVARERGQTRSENVHRAPEAPAPHYQPLQPQHAERSPQQPRGVQRPEEPRGPQHPEEPHVNAPRPQEPHVAPHPQEPHVAPHPQEPHVAPHVAPAPRPAPRPAPAPRPIPPGLRGGAVRHSTGH